MHTYSILLIDPFRNLVNAYQILLREEGYEVESALNLEEAYSYILKKSFSIILLEYLYPYEATEEFIRKIKRDSPETYLIMISNALIDGETYERLFNAGLDEFILKPYSPDKILVHIKKGLKERERIIEIEKLKRLNLVDPISEKLNHLIFNKNFLEALIQKELRRSKRHKHSFSLLLITLPSKIIEEDRFNEFIKDFLNLIRINTREEDVVSKNNGEIGILLPETNQKGCQALHQRLEGLINEHPSFRADKGLCSYLKTLSFRFFTFPEHAEILESLKF